MLLLTWTWMRSTQETSCTVGRCFFSSATMRRTCETQLPRIRHVEMVARIFAVALRGRKKLLPNVTPVFSWSPQHCFFAVCSPFPGVHLHVVYVWLELSGFLGERFLCCSRGTERQDGWAGSGNAFVFFPLYILR